MLNSSVVEKGEVTLLALRRHRRTIVGKEGLIRLVRMALKSEYGISKTVPYKCSEESSKGSHSNEGILEVGRVVWTEEVFHSHHPATVRGRLRGRYRVVVD